MEYMFAIVMMLTISNLVAWKYADSKSSSLSDMKDELNTVKEKLRLLKLMHPEAINTDSTFYSYEPTGCVVRKGENLEIIEYVCDMIASPEKDAEYYGYLIADLLNKNQETS